MENEVYEITVAVPEGGRDGAIIMEADPVLKDMDFFDGNWVDDHLMGEEDYGTLPNDPGVYKCKIKIMAEGSRSSWTGPGEYDVWMRIIEVKELYLV